MGMKDIVNRIIDKSDIILYVFDARFPKETLDFGLIKRLKKENKKLIFVANKCDLVKDKKKLEKLKDKFKPCVYLAANKRLGTGILRDKLKEISKEIKNSEKKEGKIKVGVIGFPNVGKSSLINVLVGRHVAKTGNLPGVTVGEQWISLSNDILLLDSPGVTGGRKKDEDLIIAGCLRIEKEKNPDLAAIRLIKKYKDKICNYYNIENYENLTEEEILNKIGEMKKMFIKGGDVDINRVSRKIIKDFNEGRFE